MLRSGTAGQKLKSYRVHFLAKFILVFKEFVSFNEDLMIKDDWKFAYRYLVCLQYVCVFVSAQGGSQHIYQPIGKPGERTSILIDSSNRNDYTLEKVNAVKNKCPAWIFFILF